MKPNFNYQLQDTKLLLLNIFSDADTVVHLYDTSLTFKNRLYSALDVDLCRVRLHQSFAEIMNQPLIYIRDIIPRDCLECVLRLNQVGRTFLFLSMS